MTETAPARRGSPAPPRRRQAIEPELSFEALRHESQEALVARGAAYVQEYVRIEHNEVSILKSLARVLISLRLRCALEDGTPDVAGRSYDYRLLAAEVYGSAGLPADSEGRVQAKVRYHISSELRKVVTADDLAEHGLQPASSTERQRETRMLERAVVTASRSTPPKRAAGRRARSSAVRPADVVRAKVDHLRLGEGALNILRSLQPDVIREDMTDSQRAILDGYLADAQDLLRTLRRATRTREA